MDIWNNRTGRPLSDDKWLKAHHLAKLSERTAFIRGITNNNPNTIVDLGCATGLWLQLLNDVLPESCSLIGVDSDLKSLSIAKKRAETWNRKVEFIHQDLSENDLDWMPSADAYLIFNVIPYITNPNLLLNSIFKVKKQNSKVFIRQYDGAALRFGPFETSKRMNIERELFTALSNSTKINHYDLDRTYVSINSSKFVNKKFNFELFQRVSPFPEDFIDYFKNMMLWSANYITDESRKHLIEWMESTLSTSCETPSYFIETDLIAELS